MSSKKKTTGLKAFAKKTAVKKTTTARKTAAGAPMKAAATVDAPDAPRGRPAAREDRAVAITIKLSRAQYKALKVRGAERGETVQETGFQALVKLFEDEGLSF